jgi:hypothetical protein
LVQGGPVEGPADAKTPVQAVGAGLQITVPVTIPPDVAIPSIPGFPLGIPVGGGIPTNVTISLARTAITAGSGTQNGFAGSILAGVPPASASRVTAAPAPPASAAASPLHSALTTAAPAAGAAVAASPSQPRAVPAAIRTPDLTPAFRWTLLTAIVALLCGWPLARRRVAGVPGLSASAVLHSLTDSGRRR